MMLMTLMGAADIDDTDVVSLESLVINEWETLSGELVCVLKRGTDRTLKL